MGEVNWREGAGAGFGGVGRTRALKTEPRGLRTGDMAAAAAGLGWAAGCGDDGTMMMQGTVEDRCVHRASC